MASLILPSAAKRAQNPTVILAIVEQNENPKGHCCSWSLMEPNDFRIKGRQLKKDPVCTAKDDNLLQFIDRDAAAIVKGFSQGAQVTDIRLESDLTSTATLSELWKLQFKNEFSAVTSNHLGSDRANDD
jgi:hypothetical protein